MYVLEGTGGFTSQAASQSGGGGGGSNKAAPVLAIYKIDDGRFVVDGRALQANF